MMAWAVSSSRNSTRSPMRCASLRYTSFMAMTPLTWVCFTVTPSFTAVALPRISLQVSTSAIASLHEKENATWIDINYPDYNATIHATYTPVDNTTLNATLANRSERIALDLGDTTFENISINNPDGTSANIYATRNNMVTPLMFLATDHKSWILSGAVAFDGTSTINYDSVSPIVNTLQRDLIHSLQNLSQQ